MQTMLVWAAVGTLFPFLMTTLGSATVFLFRGKVNPTVQRVFLGFAAGVMIAASVWSLLIPAIEEAQAAGQVGWLPAAGGFLLGVAMLMGLDTVIPHLHPGSNCPEGVKCGLGRSSLLMLAVTLHNIPEGMAVGLAIALSAQHNSFASALALSIGLGIQNLPEGAAISLPLRQEGRSTLRSFAYGALSGIVEPICGILVVLAAAQMAPLMPWLLSFAAGAMLYVVVEELIPAAQLGEHSHSGTLGVISGFLIMMILDVALGA